jgi:cyclopropane-fatty-acyl-phospholipid synthase
MNVFAPDARFDRVVSVEMFEHMMNWRELMTRIGAWLKPDGRFFVHIFTHRSGAGCFSPPPACSVTPMAASGASFPAEGS